MTRCYFAYGSNMDADQMGRRCSAAAIIGTASLEGYRFIINSRGVATVAPYGSDLFGPINLQFILT